MASLDVENFFTFNDREYVVSSALKGFHIRMRPITAVEATPPPLFPIQYFTLSVAVGAAVS